MLQKQQRQGQITGADQPDSNISNDPFQESSQTDGQPGEDASKLLGEGPWVRGIFKEAEDEDDVLHQEGMGSSRYSMAQKGAESVSAQSGLTSQRQGNTEYQNQELRQAISGSTSYDRSPYIADPTQMKKSMQDESKSWLSKGEYDLYNRFQRNEEDKSRSSRSNSSDDLRINTKPPDFAGGTTALGRRNESMHQYGGGAGRGNLQTMQQPLLPSRQSPYFAGRAWAYDEPPESLQPSPNRSGPLPSSSSVHARKEGPSAHTQHVDGLGLRTGDSAQAGSQLDQDEENTPYLRPSSDIELKPMTQQQAKGLSRASWQAFASRSSSQLQDHYDSSKVDTSSYDAMFGGFAAARMAAEGERRPMGRTPEDFDRMFAEADSRALESRLAAARNKVSVEGASGAVVATGKDYRREEEHQQLIARQRQLEENQKVHVQMAHAPAYSDYESEVRGEETIGKSRIGMRSTASSGAALMLPSFESSESRKPALDEGKTILSLPPGQSTPSQKNNGNAGRLNNEQSRQLQEYQEKTYRAAAEASTSYLTSSPSYTTTSVQSTLHQKEIVSSSHPAASGSTQTSSTAPATYVSKYGKQYMREQASAAQERKNQKLTTHVKKDIGPQERTQQQVQKQLHDRAERKKQVDDSQPAGEAASDTLGGASRKTTGVGESYLDGGTSWDVGDGMGELASSLFEEKGRKEHADRLGGRRRCLEEASVELERMNRPKFVENDAPSSGEREDTRLVRKKYEDKKDKTNQVLEHAKEELRSVVDTVHPNKLKGITPGSPLHPQSLHPGPSEITDVRQNLFMAQHSSQVGFRSSGPHHEDSYLGDEFSAKYLARAKESPSYGRVHEYGLGSASSQGLSYAQHAGSTAVHNSLRANPNLATSASLYATGAGSAAHRARGYSGLEMAHNRHDGPGAGKAHAGQAAYSTKHAQQYGDSMAPKEKHYFYESPSKYISLRKFSDFQFSDMHQEQEEPHGKAKGAASTGQGKQGPADATPQVATSSEQQGYSLYSQHILKQMKSQKGAPSLKEWFSQLLNHEKAIALTIVDADVVNLVRSMHALYLEYGHGHYGLLKDQTRHSSDGRAEQVGDYQLHFRRRNAPPPRSERTASVGLGYGENLRGPRYDYYGSLPEAMEGKAGKAREKSEDCLLSELRIVKVGNEPALTVSNYMLENTAFFLMQMRQIDEDFMMTGLKIEKTETKMAMSKSVLSKDRVKDDMKGLQEGRTSHGSSSTANRKQGGRGTRDSDVFFTLNEREGKTQPKKKPGAAATAPEALRERFRERTSIYKNVGTKSSRASQQQWTDGGVHEDRSRLSLGQVLAHMFEKAINVQYCDFLGKLTNVQKEFFFYGSEDHLYSRDMHIAKFWMNLEPAERDHFWQKIEDEKGKIVDAIKQHEAFKQAQTCEEPIKEVTDDAQSDSQGSAAGYPFSKRKVNYISGYGERVDADSQESSSDDDQNSGWPNQRSQAKMSAHKLKNKNYFAKDHADDSDEEVNRYAPHSNGSSSNEDNENHSSSQHHWKLGYRPLPEGSDEDKSSGPRRAAQRQSTTPILRSPGRGHKALDSSHEGDTDEEDGGVPARRITAQDSSRYFEEDAAGMDRRLGALQDAEGHRMKPIYSARPGTSSDLNRTKVQEPSPYDSEQYPSNYDADDFEDNTDDHEIDDNGDFELPANHSQNIDTSEPNIKLQIKASKNQSQAQASQFTATPQTQKKYQSTGTGTDFSPQKSSLANMNAELAQSSVQEPPKSKKKNKAGSKKSSATTKTGNKQFKQVEEEKDNEQSGVGAHAEGWAASALSLSAQQKSQAQMQQNKQDQNEHKVRRYFAAALRKLQDEGDQGEKTGATGNSSENELVRLNRYYKFVREVSTYAGLPEQGRRCPSLERLTKELLHDAVSRLLESEWQSRLAKDLEHLGNDDGTAPTPKKTSNKKSAVQPSHQQPQAAITTGASAANLSLPSADGKPASTSAAPDASSATNPQGLSKSQLKKHKKKNRKRKEAQLASGENEDAREEAEKQKEPLSGVEEEGVSALEFPEIGGATSAEQGAVEGEGQGSGKARRKKHKKKKKKGGEEQAQNEDQRDDKEEKEQPVGGGEKKEETSTSVNDGRGASGQKMGPEIVVSPPSPEKGVETGAVVLKEPKAGQAKMKKEKPATESSKIGAASDKQVHEGNAYVDGDRELQEVLKSKLFESEQSKQRTRRENNELEMRRSLLRPEVHLDKYPEEGLKETILAESARDEGPASDPDAEFSAFAAEFAQDDDLKMFNVDTGAGMADSRADELLLDSTAKRLGARREEAAQIAQAQSKKVRHSTAEVMQATAGMMSDFADLHDQVKVLGERGHAQYPEDPSAKDGAVQKEAPRTLQFTDLKQEKQLRQRRTAWALKSSDYREKAEEVDSRAGDLGADAEASKVGEGESVPGQAPKAEEGGEKKKKSKKKKNKKKKAQEEGPSADAETVRSQAAQCLRDVEDALRKEKLDPDNDSEEGGVILGASARRGPESGAAEATNVLDGKLDRSDDDQYFDDDFYMKDVDHADIELEVLEEGRHEDERRDGDPALGFDPRKGQEPYAAQKKQEPEAPAVSVQHDIQDIAKVLVRGAWMGAEDPVPESSSRVQQVDSQVAQAGTDAVRAAADLTLDGDEPDISSSLPVVPDAPSSEASKAQEAPIASEKDQAQKSSTNNQQLPAVSRRRLEKQTRRKEAKQNAKLKQQQQKQEKEAQKAQRAQQRRETLEQQKLAKMAGIKEAEEAEVGGGAGQSAGNRNQKHLEESKQSDEVKLQMEIIQQTVMQKDLALPGLDALSKDQQQVGRPSAVRQPGGKKSKQVQFKRDESYESSRIPKRGSSRGTSMASSTKNDKDDQMLTELAGLFAKEYTEPHQSTTQSISESLNSKKGSPAGSIGNEEAAQQIQTKNLKRLEDLKPRPRGERVSLMALEGAPRGRSSSAERLRKDQRSTSSLQKQKSQSPPGDGRTVGKSAFEVEIPTKKAKSKQKKEAKELKKAEAAEKAETRPTNSAQNTKKANTKDSKPSGTALQQSSTAAALPQQIEIVRSEPPKPVSKQQKKSKKGKQDGNSSAAAHAEGGERAKKSQGSNARAATASQAAQDAATKSAGHKKDDERRKDQSGATTKQDKTGKGSSAQRGQQQNRQALAEASPRGKAKVDDASGKASALPSSDQKPAASSGQTGKQAEGKKDGKKDAQKRLASGKAAKDKDAMEKSQMSMLHERGPDLLTVPKTAEAAQAFLPDQSAVAKSSTVNPLSLDSSVAASASLSGSTSPAAHQKQSVISDQRLQEILSGNVHHGSNQAAAADRKHEEAKSGSLTLPGNASSADDAPGGAGVPQSHKSRKESRQMAQASSGATSSSLADLGQQQHRSNMMQSMLQSQYVGQQTTPNSASQIQQSANSAGGQWQKTATPFLMDQMNNGNQQSMMHLQKQQDCNQQMLRLGQPQNMPQQAQFDQARMLVGLGGGLNPMSFMAGGGNMPALAQSQQQSTNINGASSTQGSIGGNSGGNGNSSSTVPPQQQQTQQQTQISIDFIRFNVQLNQVPVPSSQGPVFEQAAGTGQQRTQNQLCLPGLLEGAAGAAATATNSATATSENSSLSQHQQTSPGAGQGQSSGSGGSHGQIVQISASQNRDGPGAAEILATQGGQGPRPGLQQQPHAGNSFIQGSFGNLTINGIAPSMQAGTNNMGQHSMNQIGTHLATSNNAGGATNLSQASMGSIPPMSMNMNAAMSRMANTFQMPGGQGAGGLYQSGNQLLVPQPQAHQQSSGSQSSPFRSSSSYGMSPHAMQNNFQAMMATAQAQAHAQAQAQGSQSGTMGGLMNQAPFAAGNPLCSMGSMNNGMNAFNQANNGMNAMGVNASGQGMGMGVAMGMHPPSMGFMGGINQLSPAARYMPNDAMTSTGGSHPLSQLPNNLNSSMSGSFNQMQQVPLQHQSMSHQGLMPQGQMLNQHQPQFLGQPQMQCSPQHQQANGQGQHSNQVAQHLQQQMLFNHYLQFMNQSQKQQMSGGGNSAGPGQQQVMVHMPNQQARMQYFQQQMPTFGATAGVNSGTPQSKMPGQGSKKNNGSNKNHAQGTTGHGDQLQSQYAPMFGGAGGSSSAISNQQQLGANSANTNGKGQPKQYQGQPNSRKHSSQQYVSAPGQQSSASAQKNQQLEGQTMMSAETSGSQGTMLAAGQQQQQFKSGQHWQSLMGQMQPGNAMAQSQLLAPQGLPMGGQSMQKLPDGRASQSHIYTNASTGGDESFKQSNSGTVGSIDVQQTSASKANASGSSKVAEASQSPQDQYQAYMIQQLQQPKDSSSQTDKVGAKSTQSPVHLDMLENPVSSSADKNQAEGTYSHDLRKSMTFSSGHGNMQMGGNSSTPPPQLPGAMGHNLSLDHSNHWHGTVPSSGRPSPQYPQMMGQYFHQNHHHPGSNHMNQQQMAQLPTQQQLQNFAMQQQVFCRLHQLRCQGYILNNDEYAMLMQNLTPNELQHVHEFYEVLDAQILKLQQDQEIKLQKTAKLRQIAFTLIRDEIKGLYRSKVQKSAGGGEQTLENQVKVEIYGSMATGLAIDSSDLDILVHDFVDSSSPRFHQMSRQELIEEMQMIHRALGSVFALQSSTLIDSAAVPVIKLKMDLIKLCRREKERDESFEVDPSDLEQDEETKELNIDITLDEPKKAAAGMGNEANEHLGLQCCKYIKRRLEEYPKIKILALVFKKFLSLKDLNKPYSGGLSSYSLVQMILALLRQEEQQLNYLKQLDSVALNCAQLYQDRLSVGMIFKHFIYEYGFQFDSVASGIDKDGLFKPKEALSYILHQPSCHINKTLARHEKEDNPQAAMATMTDVPCTCGAGSGMMSHHAQRNKGGDVVQGAGAEEGGPGAGNILEMLRGLLTTGKAPPGMHGDAKETTPIDSESGGKYKRGGSLAHMAPPQLIIVDPLNKYNNIGKSSYNFQVIQDELRDVYKRLNFELVQFVRFVARGHQGAGGLPQNAFQSSQQARGLHDSTMQSSLLHSGASTDSFDPVGSADMIDGLIPRILQIDYKIIQHESVPLEQANLPDNERLSQPEELPTVAIRQPKGRGTTSKKQQRADTGEEADAADLADEQEATATPSPQAKAEKKAAGSKQAEDKTKMEESKQSEAAQTTQSADDAHGLGQGALADSSERQHTAKQPGSTLGQPADEQKKKAGAKEPGASTTHQKHKSQGQASGGQTQATQKTGQHPQKSQGQKKKGHKGGAAQHQHFGASTGSSSKPGQGSGDQPKHRAGNQKGWHK